MFGLSTALFPQATIVSHLNPPCNVDQFSGGSREGAWGGQVPAPYFFFSKMRPEGPKKFIFETGAPPPLSQCLDDHPPYLMVWIRHRSLQCLGADSRVLCI